MKRSMEADELRNFIEVLITILISLTYCYFISSRIPMGKLSLLSLFHVISIFILLPLFASSVALQITLGLFIAWLANFKLLLYAFENNSLSSSTYNDQSFSFLHFILLTSLPIKIKQTPFQNMKIKNIPFYQIPANIPFYQIPAKHFNSLSQLSFAMKMLLWSSLIRSYEYKDYMHPFAIRVVYSFRMCYGVHLIFAISAVFVQWILGYEVEPQFNNPLLNSTSLQDFWGKRWNLMVSTTLRNTVYTPLRSFLTPILGKRCALNLAILFTFGVSGLMHELAYFYVGQVWPTWQVFWFFVIHGVCLAIEIEVKKGLKGRWRLHPWVSGVLAIGFVVSTSFWLCFIELIKFGADVREIKEYAALVEYAKHALRGLTFGTIINTREVCQ